MLDPTCVDNWQDIVMLAWILASRIMLYFGPIQALGLHGHDS